MAELLEGMEDKIRWVRLIPSGGGKFEVTVNGQLVYSKIQTGRHPDDGELTKLIASVDGGKG
jgi:selenoprotein W-related protein